MVYVREIVDYIQKNPQIGSYGDGYSIQVFSGGHFEANIERHQVPILKMVQSNKAYVEFYLNKEDEKYAIDSTKKCVLKESDTIFGIFDTFKEHEGIEEALTVLLKLQKDKK